MGPSNNLSIHSYIDITVLFTLEDLNQLRGLRLLLLEAKYGSGLIMSIINTGLILKVVDRLENW